MKSIIQKKNQKIISRKQDEESPDKITRERRTLEETPRASVDDQPQFKKKKPDLVFEVTAVVNSASDEP